MKKFLAVLFIVVVGVFFISSNAYALTLTYGGQTREYTGPTVNLVIENKDFIFPDNGMPPIILNNRTLVPVREVFEELGGKVEWDAVIRKVTINLKGKTIGLIIDDMTATVDGEAIQLDVPAKIINSKTMVPVRFISENGGLNVEWDAATYTVKISKKEEKQQEITEEIKTIFDMPQYKSDVEEIVEAYRDGRLIDTDGVAVRNEEDVKNFMKQHYFEEWFDEYIYAIREEYNKILEESLKKELTLRDGQIAYMIANDISIEDIDSTDVLKYEVPVEKKNKSKMTQEIIAIIDGMNSVEMKQKQEEIQKIQDEIAIYEIKKKINIDGLEENVELYMDDKEEVKYFLSWTGVVFTLPGLKIEDNNGNSCYYVTGDKYYIVSDNPSKIQNKDVIILEKTIKASDFKSFKPIILNEFYDYSIMQRASFNILFGEYIDNIRLKALSLKAKMGAKGIAINNAQSYYMASKSVNPDEYINTNIKDYSVPEGYKIPKAIQKALGVEEEHSEKIVAYLIDDTKIEGYEETSHHTFYGNYNGKEKHFVTSNGIVFTLPGIAMKDEIGNVKYYINTNPNSYYTVSEKENLEENVIKSAIQASDLRETASVKMEISNSENKEINKTKDEYQYITIPVSGLVADGAKDDSYIKIIKIRNGLTEVVYEKQKNEKLQDAIIPVKAEAYEIRIYIDNVEKGKMVVK